MCPRPTPLSAHLSHTIIGYGHKTVYGYSITYITGTAEGKKKDIGVKSRNFGVKTRNRTEIGQKLDRNRTEIGKNRETISDGQIITQ